MFQQRCLQVVSVLQCVVVCCSMLQYAAVCCSVLQCAAVCCSAMHLYSYVGSDISATLIASSMCVSECCRVL